MRFTIAAKIFAIALSLLVLMAAVVVIGLRLFDQVGQQLQNVVHDYLPIYGAVATANVQSLEQGTALRRVVIRDLDKPPTPESRTATREAVARAGKGVGDALGHARKLIAQRLAEPGAFEDVVAVARLDARVEAAAELQVEYESRWPPAIDRLEGGEHEAFDRELAEIDRLRDKINGKFDQLRDDIAAITERATAGVLAQQRAVEVAGVAGMVLALLLGMAYAALLTRGLVRPVYRLLDGTKAVQGGQLDTLVPVTSRDEIGRLTTAFNAMVVELRLKERIKATFGRYVDPRIVAGLIDRPDLAKVEGERRTMTILFCDMKGFTGLSEGMTPAALVRLINAYLTDLSVPIRERHGIIDKYIGDAVMAYWGPPFNQHEEQAGLACLAALDQLDRLAAFRAAVPEIVGVKRGLPEIDIRVGIATGDVVVGNIGSDVAMNYTVMGDTVNLASRLEGASKAYGTRILISEETRLLAGEAIVVREIDRLLVVGKSEPQRIYELLGRKGQVPAERLELAHRFALALEAYRGERWAEAEAGFAALAAEHPMDGPSATFLKRTRLLAATPPVAGWDGVWHLTEK
jgi:class 3 adenylate cyclase